MTVKNALKAYVEFSGYTHVPNFNIDLLLLKRKFITFTYGTPKVGVNANTLQFFAWTEPFLEKQVELYSK